MEETQTQTQETQETQEESEENQPFEKGVHGGREGGEQSEFGEETVDGQGQVDQEVAVEGEEAKDSFVGAGGHQDGDQNKAPDLMNLLIIISIRLSFARVEMSGTCRLDQQLLQVIRCVVMR